MTEYSKYNVIYRLQRRLDSVPGQTFLHYAYRWGASIVILGTLFKLTHLPGANLMLYLGMGTEVIVFFISAFDRPFDKTAIGKELPTHVTDDYLEGREPSADEEPVAGQSVVSGASVPPGMVAYVSSVGGQVAAAEGAPAGGMSVDGATADVQEGASAMQGGGILSSGQAVVAGQPVPGWVAGQQQVSPEMEEATTNYVEELKKLTETLAKVSEQSERLTRDSEEMENLNRTLTGICKVYEMQLKGASSQIGTIDEINEQSRRMASQIEQLNKIYARMIEAMTVNMRATTANGNNAEG